MTGDDSGESAKAEFRVICLADTAGGLSGCTCLVRIIQPLTGV
jgi:hypothetical protein